jgi:signal transduction histidine kinase
VTTLKRKDAINASYLRLLKFAVTHSADELLEETLNEAEKLTGSLIGFYHFVDADQQALTLQNWSTRTKTEFCKAEGKGQHYAINAAGVWVDCVYERKPVIHNDYASLPHRKGMPAGHAEVIRELVVPVLRGANIRAILGVGNKAANYVDEDVEAVSLLADLAWEIAERKLADEAVARLNAELEQRVADRTAQLAAANKDLEAFSYSVSHDLRAPLRHIDGFIELLRERNETLMDEESKHYITVIRESAMRMSNLITDLLSFSRMGRSELRESRVDLNDLVQDVIREYRPETEGREVEWQIAELPTVTGDPAMLRVVLANLVSNALKFTRTRAAARIEIGCLQEDENEVALFVRDNGVGFDMRYVDKLFGVFQRLHGVNEFEGTGIGLANVRQVIQRHGGKTWAEGALDQGATIYFTLPRD